MGYVWTRHVGLGQGHVAGCWVSYNKASGSIKYRRMPWSTTELLLASQEFACIKSVTFFFNWCYPGSFIIWTRICYKKVPPRVKTVWHRRWCQVAGSREDPDSIPELEDSEHCRFFFTLWEGAEIQEICTVTWNVQLLYPSDLMREQMKYHHYGRRVLVTSVTQRIIYFSYDISVCSFNQIHYFIVFSPSC